MNDKPIVYHFGEAGWCKNCGVHRLSVADIGGICMHCIDEGVLPVATHEKRTERETERRILLSGKEGMCKCGRGPKEYRGQCTECALESAKRLAALKRFDGV